MKKTLFHLFIPILFLAVSSCKKPCFTCIVFVVPRYQIDTFYYYGQIKYDTFNGLENGLLQFTSCDIDTHYHYGNYTLPSAKSYIDTVTNCQQNNY
jgi:hypothetical protein